jgi:site-specific DNA-methyltransferase (cytosine-N4-specific)
MLITEPAAAPKLLSLGRSEEWSFQESRPHSPHRLHPYPAKFIPELAAACIDSLEIDGPVLDPFCGSGTTLVEAQRRGFGGVGVDLNPVACLVAEVKTALQSESVMRDFGKLGSLIDPSAASGELWDAPRVEHWFADQPRAFLADAQAAINSLHDRNLRQLARLSICKIMTNISRQESDTRYAAQPNELSYEDCYRKWLLSIASVFEELREYHSSLTSPGEVKIILGDSRELRLLDIGEGSFAGAVFSPPYPNAYEYWLYHKYRAYWLGENPILVRELEIGARPHYSKPNNLTSVDFASDLASVFDGLIWALDDSNKTAVVIGSSVIKGEVVDNAQIVVETAETTGFTFAGRVARTLPSKRRTFRASRLAEEDVLFFARS